jgi:uncharacterized delta-60 repeat protein
MNDIAIDGNRNILVAGSGPFFVMRHLPDGGVDTSFGSAGVFNYQPSSSGFANATALALQPDGKIVVVGSQSGPRPPTYSLVIRLNSNGPLDSTFGSGGLTSFIPSGAKNGGLRTVAIQSLGAANYIVAGGDLGQLGRLTPSGAIGSTFGSGGQAVGPTCGGTGRLRGTYVDASGNIFLLGYSYAGTGAGYYINLPRYTASGVLDTTFGDAASGGGHTGDTFLNVFGGLNVPGFNSSLGQQRTLREPQSSCLPVTAKLQAQVRLLTPSSHGTTLTVLWTRRFLLLPARLDRERHGDKVSSLSQTAKSCHISFGTTAEAISR